MNILISSMAPPQETQIIARVSFSNTSPSSNWLAEGTTLKLRMSFSCTSIHFCLIKMRPDHHWLDGSASVIQKHKFYIQVSALCMRSEKLLWKSSCKHSVASFAHVIPIDIWARFRVRGTCENSIWKQTLRRHQHKSVSIVNWLGSREQVCSLE